MTALSIDLSPGEIVVLDDGVFASALVFIALAVFVRRQDLGGNMACWALEESGPAVYVKAGTWYRSAQRNVSDHI